jgi:carbamoyl-phosphate synthase small subunit
MHPNAQPEALLLLEDGTVFPGRAAVPGTRFGEVVFNTSMTGYQEILTDPSYRGQIVVMTLPHIGNYGTSELVAESVRPWVEGFVARQFTAEPAGHSHQQGLRSYLEQHRIPAIEGVDTRAIVRRLRERGALRGVLTSERSDVASLLAELREFPTMTGRALVDEVTCARRHEVPASGTHEPRYHLAVYDFGCKANILRELSQRGARLTVFPAGTPASEVLALGVDGLVLSNGPGDPEPLAGPIAAVRELIATDLPTLGICLGHQLLGLALGGSTFKLKFGHRGGNQPVRHAVTGVVTITSQNHGFALDPASLPVECQATEFNLNDGTLEAFLVRDRPITSVQYHPEAAPGPHDAAAIFQRFLDFLPKPDTNSRALHTTAGAASR